MNMVNDILFKDRKSNELLKEVPPGLGWLKFLYGNPLGKLSLELLIKKSIVSRWYGKAMDREKSVDKIRPFVNELGIDMTESVKSIEEFTSFNDFFYRELKSNARPIQNGVVSPGDGKILVFKEIQDINRFFVKGERFTIDSFLSNKTLSRKYDDGSLVILRLAPNDYHRYHFPIGGKVDGTTLINGVYYSVSPLALYENFTKVFCKNKRTLTSLSTEICGDVLLIPVGATMVGSINNTFKENSQVHKGDEMGYFSFGGSTIVLLFEKGKIEFSQDLVQNTNEGYETFVKMGETIGLPMS